MTAPERPQLSIERRANETVVLRMSGPWRMRGALPGAAEVEDVLAAGTARTVAFDTTALTDWDSGALIFLDRVAAACRKHRLQEDRTGLPGGVQRLLALAEAVPPRRERERRASADSLLARIGKATATAVVSAGEVLRFLGEVALAAARLATGRARMRRSDLVLFIQQAGADALAIVTLISFLVGLILAFVGAVQLEQFGATIYVANLVGVAIVRDMGAMMTAIVMAGRTGASYAAQLGSMQVTQEIDALTTMGISAVEYLVLPRVTALFLMMPLLCLYSDFVGILGGAAVGVGMLDLAPAIYYNQTVSAVKLDDLVGGLFKAAVYGALIGVSGCLRGMQSGRSSSAVGDATTAAVVTSIVFIIGACGVFAVLFYILGI
jgi:phospholipid/cholesterol/gamma-HCH transport system permease protein